MSERIECLTGSEREKAEEQVGELMSHQFLLDGDAQEFIEHVHACRHIHWPASWGEKIEEIFDRTIGGI